MPPKPVTPGSYADEHDARQFLRLRLFDRTLDVVPTVDMNERFLIRQQTGFPFDAFLEAIGTDSLCVLWWVGRRQNGEPKLPFAKVKDEWPMHLGDDDWELTEVDLDDKDEDELPEDASPES